MIKGLAIMLAVFLIIGSLHIISLKLLHSSERRKVKFRKVFYYLYGIIFLGQGITRMLETQKLNLFSLGLCLFGILFIALNRFGKIPHETL